MNVYEALTDHQKLKNGFEIIELEIHFQKKIKKCIFFQKLNFTHSHHP